MDSAISTLIDMLVQSRNDEETTVTSAPMTTDAPVTTRVQLALNVDDLDAAVSFYSRLFRTEPAKLRPGYANFAIAQPPLKLVLLENPGATEHLNHLGVEMAGVDEVDAEQSRLAEVGLASVDERGTTCCYAKQDKFWVQGAPDGTEWEIYTVLSDSPTFFAEVADLDSDACCSSSASPTTAACC